MHPAVYTEQRKQEKEALPLIRVFSPSHESVSVQNERKEPIETKFSSSEAIYTLAEAGAHKKEGLAEENWETGQSFSIGRNTKPSDEEGERNNLPSFIQCSEDIRSFFTAEWSGETLEPCLEAPDKKKSNSAEDFPPVKQCIKENLLKVDEIPYQGREEDFPSPLFIVQRAKTSSAGMNQSFPKKSKESALNTSITEEYGQKSKEIQHNRGHSSSDLLGSDSLLSFLSPPRSDETLGLGSNEPDNSAQGQWPNPQPIQAEKTTESSLSLKRFSHFIGKETLLLANHFRFKQKTSKLLFFM